jgi:hypothetical protein
MASHELYSKMEAFWGEFSENHSKFTETEYRKASVAESKRS